MNYDAANMALDVGRESKMFSLARPTSTERGVIRMRMMMKMMSHMLTYNYNYTTGKVEA